jgi:hypothetical protein
MTKSTRLAAVACLLAGLLAAAPISRAQTPPNIGKQMAKTCGLDGFGQIEAIRFTFNAQVLGNNVSRSWVWWPKTGQNLL